jgi:hypothetical protein
LESSIFSVTEDELVIIVAVPPKATGFVVVLLLESVTENSAAFDTLVEVTVTCLNVGIADDTATVTFAVLVVTGGGVTLEDDPEYTIGKTPTASVAGFVVAVGAV